jgi:hypothetical protein
MKKTLFIFFSLIILSCAKDDDTSNAALAFNPEIDFTDLNASGDLSEQTSEQAKKTIYGKWDFGNSSKSSGLGEKNNQATNSIFGKRHVRNNSKSSELGKNLTCAFNFIEFNDDTYLMAIESDGYSEYLPGDYVINENSDSKVTSVDLKFNLGLEEITIATLTDIIVVETDSKLDATFEISLNIPEDADFATCNSLSGSVSVDKDEPLEASSSATADTNHAKLIKTWNFDSYFNSEDPNVNNIPLILQEVCLDYEYTVDDIIETPIPNCTAPTNLSITFSTYGTYTFFYSGGSDGIVIDEIDSWNYVNESTYTESDDPDDFYETFGIVIGDFNLLYVDPAVWDANSKIRFFDIESLTDDTLEIRFVDDYYRFTERIYKFSAAQ